MGYRVPEYPEHQTEQTRQGLTAWGRDFMVLRQGDLAVEAMDRAIAKAGVSRCYPYRDRWKWLRRLYLQGRASPALLRAFTARLSRHTPQSLRTLMDLHLRSGVDLVCPVMDERGCFDI
ncbi:hypothetical protein [Desulfovibrio psychrotolerans]|uniref:Uncharacterized protein n=1 Tax=Desulfovibrio psychrotolerans TaxID=415242 RepID=A0A7J0BUT6_9BACT|nr:hypothetical protein [Desulfovibrio psychrotolerans]GFM36935.1 hypothetical protein DSM19430T_16190 [Desulfovibrio psychrotolerans]